MIGMIILVTVTLWFTRLLEAQEADRRWHRAYMDERRRVHRG